MARSSLHVVAAALLLAACSAQPIAPAPPAPVYRSPPAAPVPLLRPLAVTFPALGDDDVTIPPGPSGAVGPQHLVAIAGTQLRIQTKAGSVIATQPLASLFAPLPHTAHAGGRVVFDALASRWIVVAQADAGAAIELAVSLTADPTGGWHAYDLPSAAGDVTNVRAGFSSTMIAISADLVTHGTTSSLGVRIYACAKADLYAGTLTCHATDHNVGDLHVEPALDYDADGDGAILVERDFEQPGVRILQVSGAVSSEVFSSVGYLLNVGTWAAEGPQTNLGFAQQAGSLNRLDTGDDRITSAVVRGHHVYAAQTVYLPQIAPTHAAIQWFELDPGAFSPVQIGRIDGSSSAFDYAYPTIAVNASHDVMVTFAKFGASISPSIGYASRMHADSPSDLSTPALIQAGAGPYAKTHGGTVNRWGGAGGAAADPSDGTTLWAIAAVAAAPDPSPCTIDCGNWSTVWAALRTDCTGQANGTTCDTTLCTDGVQSCSNGACIGGTPATCMPDDCHTTGICDPATGCPQTIAPDGTPCTEGVCSGGFCQHFADDFGFADDGSFGFSEGPTDPGFHVGNGSGCCQAGGSDARSALLALGLALVLRRRRR